MKFRLLAVTVVVAGLASANALAQANLGELLDMGAKKLSKEELVALLSGANMSGETRDGAVYDVTYKPNGTYSGSFFVAAKTQRHAIRHMDRRRWRQSLHRRLHQAL